MMIILMKGLGKLMNDKKLTKLEKYWIMYDVGNSAFILLVSTIIPIYFNHLSSMANISEVNYLAYWGYAASLTTAIVAIIGPVLGSIVDTKGYKNHFLNKYDGWCTGSCCSLISNVMGYLFSHICHR